MYYFLRLTNLIIMKKYIIFSFFIILVSCKKEDNPTKSFQESDNKSKLKSTSTQFFDWDNSNSQFDFIYTTQGLKSNPFRPGSEGSIPSDILEDYKRVDGWVLVYNTCGDSRFPSDYFVLYNIFRGIIRVFYYAPQAADGTQTTWSLKYNGTVSATNFSGLFAEASNLPRNNGIITTQTTSNGALNSIYKGWTYADFEIAYDSTIKNYNSDQINLSLSSSQTSISSITLNGTSNGTIKGTITSPSGAAPNSPYGSSILKPILSIYTGGASDYLRIVTKVITNSTLLSNIANNGTKTFIDNLTGSLFNSFIGTHSTTSQSTVNFSTHEDIKMNGNMITQTPTQFPTWQKQAIPGQSVESNFGLIPYYNKELGVWNIDKTPILKTYRQCPFGATPNGQYIRNQFYELDMNSFNVVLNPNILSEIEKYEVKVDLWWYFNYPTVFWNSSYALADIYNIINLNQIYCDHSSGITNYTDLYQNSNGPIQFKSGRVIVGLQLNPFSSTNPSSIPFFAPIDKMDKRFIVKVILKLWPKQGLNPTLNGVDRDNTRIYNTQPIVLVKSFIPNYLLINSPLP